MAAFGGHGLCVSGLGTLAVGSLARAMFCSDMDEDQITPTHSRMVPESVSVLSEPADLTGPAQPIPHTYVRLLQDASISLESPDADDQQPRTS